MEANGGGEGLEDDPSAELERNQAVVPQNGPDNMAAASASMGSALYLVSLRLPFQEIARCRMVCRVWRDITSTEDFRRLHHDPHYPKQPDNMAAKSISRGNAALYLALLCLPAQEIARCRRVCRVWRDITSTDIFRRHHRDHHYRTPMPLFFFLDPKLVRLNLRAVDIRNRVSRPVIRYTRPRYTRPSKPKDEVHEVLRLHGSCAGILLLSSGHRLYALNPCKRRWARLPPIHVHYDIIGFYGNLTDRGEFRCHVLYHDRMKSNCDYWIFTLGTAAPRRIGRPALPGGDELLAKGIVPSHKIPPVFFGGILHWPPKAAQDNSNVLFFDTGNESFGLIPPPTIQVCDEAVPVVGRQLIEINERPAMTVISFSPARVDVWVLNNITKNIPELWSRRYSICVPVGEIRLNNSCHHNGSVFAVTQDRNDLVQCPRILLQCDALGAVLQTYQLDGHWTSLSGHTLEESLFLHPNILPNRDRDAVGGDPPFFRVSNCFPW